MTMSGLPISHALPPSLTLVSVGPGDPSLLTLAAVKAIQNATLISYPVSKEGNEGIARQIASAWIKEDMKQLPLVFPMVSESELLKRAWRESGEKLVELVKAGEEVVFLCEGDVSLFATGSYILLYIKAHYPEFPIRLIPGVTAVSAAAAVGTWPLAMQKDQLLIVPTPDEPRCLEKLLDDPDCPSRVIALLKLGSRWTWVRPLLKRKGLLAGSLFAKRLGFIDQEIIDASEVSASDMPYFSLLLIRQGQTICLP